MWKRYLMVLIAVVATMLATNRAVAGGSFSVDLIYGLTPDALAPRIGQLVAVQEIQGPFRDGPYNTSYTADETIARLRINFSLRESWEESDDWIEEVHLTNISIRHNSSVFETSTCSDELSEGTTVVYCTITFNDPQNLRDILCDNDGAPSPYNIFIRASAEYDDDDAFPWGDFSPDTEGAGGPYTSPNIDITRTNPTFSSQDICTIDYDLDDDDLVDTDGDGIADVLDADDDDDEVVVESSPSADPGVAGPDGDGDGVSDSVDSCPDAVNTDVDADGDGIDAACDDNDASGTLAGGTASCPPGTVRAFGAVSTLCVDPADDSPACTGDDCEFGTDDTSTGVNLQRGGGGSCSVAPGASGDTLSFLLAVLGLLPLGLGRRFR